MSSDNSIKILSIDKKVNTSSSNDTTDIYKAKQQNSMSNLKNSPILNNKSCAIQNIVKNERKFYHEPGSHTDGFARPPSSNLGGSQQFNQRTLDHISLHHNQLFFLKQLDQRNSWLHFLNRGQILCVGNETRARFIDLKTSRESYLSDYIDTTDAGNRRLLGTTDKHVV